MSGFFFDSKLRNYFTQTILLFSYQPLDRWVCYFCRLINITMQTFDHKMKIQTTLTLLFLLFSFFIYGQENHLSNIQKLTFGGDNAEAYFSPDGSKLVMQVTNPAIGAECDQIYILDLNDDKYTTKDLKLVSTGKGRTTCAFFMPDGKHIIYASTHEADDACPAPPKPRADGKYVWPIFPEFDIYMADLDGNIVKKLTDEPGYDAEAVVSPNGKMIAFTSIRSGDLDLYIMDIDGNNVRQITSELGYDGGAFFSHDSKKLVFRSSRPKTDKEKREYKELLEQGLVMPTEMDIYTVNVDGTNLKQVTDLGKANWAPYFHATDQKIIFSSNHHATRGYDFQLYTVDLNGDNLEQITYESIFNAFPMFSPDGKKLVFSSNRDQGKDRETNVFIADWVEGDANNIVKQENLERHIGYLASDKLQGRLTGSKGEKKAAKYLIKEFKKLGLQPYLANDFSQTFDYNVQLNPHSNGEGIQNTGTNVIGYLDNQAKKTIIIGAHYDHLGKNEHHNSTLANSEGMIHNGADDNASGVAGVLELARIFSQNSTIEDANFVFALFSGEEDGLIGSKKLAEEVQFQDKPVIAMLNMDMIGRLNKDKALTVGGIGTSPIFGEIVQKNKPAGFNLAIDSSGIGPSDHTSFYLKDIPVLFFFTGTHDDYHKPSDDADRINYSGQKNIITYVRNIVEDLSEENEIPFTKTKTSNERAVPRYKVTLGIMPNYSDTGNGLIVDGVMDNRPGSAAGLKQGDVITQIGDCPISEVYSYMECLAKMTEGDTVEMKFIRDGKEMTTTVTF